MGRQRRNHARAFFELMDDAIEFHSVLEREFPADPLSGPFTGKAAVIGYWTAIAESWEMLASKTEAIVAEGDRVIWTGRVRWRHRRTLRELDTPKVDIWTVWQGRAIRYFEMLDSASYARGRALIGRPNRLNAFARLICDNPSARMLSPRPDRARPCPR